jgi:hypothetical protein
MLVLKIKPCMPKYKSFYGKTADGSIDQLSFVWRCGSYSPTIKITWIPLLIVELIHANRGPIGREERAGEATRGWVVHGKVFGGSDGEKGGGLLSPIFPRTALFRGSEGCHLLNPLTAHSGLSFSIQEGRTCLMLTTKRKSGCPNLQRSTG